jgi:hypothetical protein
MARECFEPLLRRGRGSAIAIALAASPTHLSQIKDGGARYELSYIVPCRGTESATFNSIG